MGIDVGPLDFDGIADGPDVGELLDRVEGFDDGDEDGLADGPSLGADEGDEEGCEVGMTDG